VTGANARSTAYLEFSCRPSYCGRLPALVIRLEEYWKVHTASPAEEIDTSRTLARGVLALLFLGTRSPSSGLSRP
jgi:hypothetical protein